jgi:hypothetical protein
VGLEVIPRGGSARVGCGDFQTKTAICRQCLRHDTGCLTPLAATLRCSCTCIKENQEGLFPAALLTHPSSSPSLPPLAMYAPTSYTVVWAELWSYPEWCDLMGCDRDALYGDPLLMPFITALTNCSTVNEVATLSASLPPELQAAHDVWIVRWKNMVKTSRLWALIEGVMSDRGVDFIQVCKACDAVVPSNPGYIYRPIVPQLAERLFGRAAFRGDSTILHEKASHAAMAFLHHTWNNQAEVFRRRCKAFPKKVQDMAELWAGGCFDAVGSAALTKQVARVPEPDRATKETGARQGDAGRCGSSNGRLLAVRQGSDGDRAGLP